MVIQILLDLPLQEVSATPSQAGPGREGMIDFQGMGQGAKPFNGNVTEHVVSLAAVNLKFITAIFGSNESSEEERLQHVLEELKDSYQRERFQSMQ